MRVTELSAQLSIDRTNVSRLCARMEAAGDITRDEQPGDARAWRLVLSRRGERAAEAVDVASSAHFASILRLLPPSAAVVSALEALSEAMRSVATERNPR